MLLVVSHQQMTILYACPLILIGAHLALVASIYIIVAFLIGQRSSRLLNIYTPKNNEII